MVRHEVLSKTLLRQIIESSTVGAALVTGASSTDINFFKKSSNSSKRLSSGTIWEITSEL